MEQEQPAVPAPAVREPPEATDQGRIGRSSRSVWHQFDVDRPAGDHHDSSLRVLMLREFTPIHI